MKKVIRRGALKMNEEKNEFKRAYKETELKWKTSNIKYKKDKIKIGRAHV